MILLIIFLTAIVLSFWLGYENGYEERADSIEKCWWKSLLFFVKWRR